MKYRRIPKENANQPPTGSYPDWKPLLAEEGSHQCVYCAISDASMGGIRNFHVEHYRPKSRFPDLENRFTNLFYACPICNTFKGNDWPTEPTLEVRCYPDPSTNDYDLLFTIKSPSGEIEGNVIASRYMVEKIYLNRGQLILERRLHILLEKEKALRIDINQLLILLPKAAKIDFLCRFNDIINEMLDLMGQLQTITPYQAQDIQR